MACGTCTIKNKIFAYLFAPVQRWVIIGQQQPKGSQVAPFCFTQKVN